MSKEDFAKDAINKMMEIAGYSARYEHLVQMGDYPWYSKYTWSAQEENEFKRWFLESFRKKFKHMKHRAEKEYGWFHLMYGLKSA